MTLSTSSSDHSRSKTSSRPASSPSAGGPLGRPPPPTSPSMEDWGSGFTISSALRASYVNSIRIRFTSPTVKTFRVTNLRYDELIRSELGSCLCFVKERHVEEMRLSFSAPFLYGLPTSLYCLSSLVSLEVSSCRFSLDGAISWPRLKVLSVERAELSEDVLKGIFMASPLLESLKLCEGRRLLKNIMIDATSLKELVLVGIDFFNVDEIWAPHLLSLRVSGDWWSISKFRLDDASSFVEAQLDFVYRTDDGNDIRTDDMRIRPDFVKELFGKLR